MTSSEVPSRLPILRPFADSGTKHSIPDETGNFMNITQGFPSVYGDPASSGGKYVSRSDMNSIGFMATNDLFYHKCGGINTFDAEFANKVGGYPKGAILQYLNGNYLYNVVSLHDNNMFNFVAENSINNSDWAYCNQQVAPTEKVLVLESNQYLYPGSSGQPQETLLGVFKSPKDGPVIFEGTITPEVLEPNHTSGAKGVGIFIMDLGESYETIPELSMTTIGNWTAISLVHGNFSDKVVGNMMATFGHYYAVKGLASSTCSGYPYAQDVLSTVKTPNRTISGAENSTRIYIG